MARLPFSRARLAPLVTAVLAASSAAAVMAFTETARADEPSRVIRFDPEAYPPPEARLNTALTGAAITAAFYAPAFGASYLWPDSPGAADLRIPVAGPWMKLFQTGCSDTEPDCSTFWIVTGAVFAGIDGLGQAGGVGIMLESIFMTTREPTQKSVPLSSFNGSGGRMDFSYRAGSGANQLWLRPVPYHAGRDGLGLGLVGIF